jgi:hypothetical protein
MGQITGLPTPGWGIQPTPPKFETSLASGLPYKPATSAKLEAINAFLERLNKRRQE